MTPVSYPALVPYTARFSALPLEPLRIVFTLRPGSRLAGYDLLHLDGILARCVVDQATGGEGLPPSSEPYDLPLPLQCLWRDEDGLPLWAATDFQPVGLSATDVGYWHKRLQNGRMSGTKSGHLALTGTKGRWMERRVPLPTIIAREWEAWCIGNHDALAGLLTKLVFVGKKRAQGFGEVESFKIEPALSFSLIREWKLTRCFPAAAWDLLAGLMPEGEPAPIAWTPPYWMPALFRQGWWTGTAIDSP